MSVARFNAHGVWAIYRFEMHRFRRTLWTGLAVPVITTSLYFIVFGSAIGSRMTEVGGVDYGSFIVPGLMMLSLFTESISNSSFGIYMPRFAGGPGASHGRERAAEAVESGGDGAGERAASAGAVEPGDRKSVV